MASVAPRRGIDLRLLGPALAAWGAAWVAPALETAGGPGLVAAVTTAGWVAAAALLSTTVAVAVASDARRKAGARATRANTTVARLATGAVAATAAAVAMQAAFIGLGVREDSPLAAAAHADRAVEVVVELDGAPRPSRWLAPWAADDDVSGDQVTIDGRVVAVDGAAVHAITATAVIRDAPKLAFGARVAFRATVQALPSEERTAVRLRPVGDDVSIAPPPPWLSWAAQLRSGFRAAASELPGDGGALVPGLAIGDTAAVGADLDAAMKASSLSHLTAVSGANCAIVTAAAFAAAAAVGLPALWRIVVAAIALLAFLALVTPEASVVRATAMALVVLAARASGRPGGGASALSVAVIVLLVSDPWLARDYGFALSASATAGLLLLAAPIGRGLARAMPRPLAAVLAVPIAAQAACQPILILLDPGIAVHGVVANLLAAPAAPVGTIVGLIGCLVLPVLPGVGLALLQGAWVPAAWIAAVAHGTAALPGARLPWLPDGVGAALLVVVTGLALWLLLATPRGRVVRWTATGALLVLIAIPVGVLTAAPALRSWTIPADWSVAACDVGQGDAMLVRSEGAVMLVDTGPDAAALETCLGRLGIAHIDLLVLTHWDADHVSGVDAVAGRVTTVLHGPLDGGRSSRALDPLVAGGAEAVAVDPGRAGRLGTTRWTVLWPPADEPPGNDASVVLRVEAPTWNGMFLGDLGESAQRRLLATAHLAPVDVVKVAHHGSADQSADLYRRLHARVGLIGVGADNGYGHPTASLLDLLRGSGTTVVRTDLDGGAALSFAGSGAIAWWSERGRARSEGPPSTAAEPSAVDPTLGAAPRAAREARWRHAQRRPGRRSRSRSSDGTRSGPPPSCWCRDPRTCSPTARSPSCETSCAPRTRPSR